jgi:hypothetical protein
LIDLNELSGQLYERLGPAKAEALASPGRDLTHFNRLGAQAMANIILRELAQARTPLTREIIEPAASFPAATPKPRKLPLSRKERTSGLAQAGSAAAPATSPVRRRGPSGSFL